MAPAFHRSPEPSSKALILSILARHTTLLRQLMLTSFGLPLQAGDGHSPATPEGRPLGLSAHTFSLASMTFSRASRYSSRNLVRSTVGAFIASTSLRAISCSLSEMAGTVFG